VKEKRKGPISRAAGIAEGLAATVRRMQREREPRVLVYDETGYARLVQPDGRGYERLLETAERMVALVDEAETPAKAGSRRTVTGGGAEPAEKEAKPRRSGRGKAAAEAEGEAAGKAGTKPRRARRATAGEGSRGKPAGKGTPKSRRAKAGERGGKPRDRTKAPAKPRRTRRAPREGDA
jgi:hypothetical protein